MQCKKDWKLDIPNGFMRRQEDKVGIPCTVEGPFPKRLPKHEIPV